MSQREPVSSTESSSTPRELWSLIARSLGVIEAVRHAQFLLDDLAPLTNSARSLMEAVEPMPGACLLLSSSWAVYLREQHGIPAVAVAGDLKVQDQWVFRSTETLPELGRNGGIVRGKWKGHCWIEVGGLVADLSIFRTAYALAPASHLRRWVEATFGMGRGGFICRYSDIPSALRFRRRFVLTERQMIGFTAGQGFINEHSQRVVQS